MNNERFIFEVLLPVRTSNTFAYHYDKPLVIGQLVLVPFRSKVIIGVILSTESKFDPAKTKSIITHYDLFLDKAFVNFLSRASNYNIISIGLLIKAVFSGFDIKKADFPDIIGRNKEQKLLLKKEIILSHEQQLAYDKLVKLADDRETILLQGVTGSGKTLVYLKYLEEILRNGGQGLLLLPEITLTTQISQRLRALFQEQVLYEWHSAITKSKKNITWKKIISGETMLLVGARSALFLPFNNLKFIIVDEEHDVSFKQDEGIIYNARDMAVLRGKISDIPVILSSATPSIETSYNCRIGKYKKVSLSQRFNDIPLPKIEIVDIRAENLSSGKFISTRLMELLRDTLVQKKQALIFINKKGYAPTTLCTNCGTKICCPNCSINLVFYKKQNVLRCHYCNYNMSAITECKNCLSDKICFYGPGAEKIEEELRGAITNARTVLATSDTLSSAKKTSELLASISNHEVDIIIGTQILAKGLDFKLLHLVGVVDADCGYASGDIRSHERLYQLLNQVSGRAGRDNEQGHVILQTYDPDNHILKSILDNDQERFIENELEDRAISNTPPFSRIAIISISASNEKKALKFAYQLSTSVPSIQGLVVLGPSSAPLYFLKNKYRFRFVLKAHKDLNLQKIVTSWLEAYAVPSYINLKIDIDPYNYN